jgi:hypothetical protein
MRYVENFFGAGCTTDGGTIWRMRFACWITKAIHTHTHSEYVILPAFPRQQWLRERASIFRIGLIECH